MFDWFLWLWCSGIPKKGYNSITSLLFPSITNCLGMGQFVFVPAFAYNKCFNTQTVTKQELPEHQVEQNPTYQNSPLEKETNKKLFAKADSLCDKILSGPPIKLSNSQTLILDGLKTGVFLLDFVQEMHSQNADVPDNYFTSFDAAGISPTLGFNQNAQAKKRGSWVPIKILTSEAGKIVHAVSCRLCSLRKLVKPRILSEPKVRQFLQSKPSETKFALATHKFKRLKAFARFKREIWCMDLA